MGKRIAQNRLLWLAAGLIMGVALGGLLPHVPLHAMAADRADGIAVATGPVDADVEAVFYLDSLTGVLIGAVPSRRPGVPFQAIWTTNVNAELVSVIQTANAGGSKKGVRGADAPKTPRYIMMTGAIDIPSRGGSRQGFARSAVYVVETHSGMVLAYAMPWSSSLRSSGAPFRSKFELWTADQLPTAAALTRDE
jgi:hypothetical protein